MKTFKIGAVAITLIAMSGCALFQPKKGDQGDSGGGGGGAAPAMDLTKMLKAPSKVSFKADMVKVGWYAKQDMGASGLSTWAVVGEDGDKLHVEYMPPGLKNYGAGADKHRMGLVVNKADGKVVSAVLGKVGEKGKKIEIQPEVKGGEAPAAEDTEVELKHLGGNHPAKLTVVKAGGGEYKSWVGSGGKYEGLLLKSTNPQGGYELKAVGEEKLDIGGTPVDCKMVEYDNGNKTWTCKQDQIKALFSGMAKMEASGTVIAIKAFGTDAKPELKW